MQENLEKEQTQYHLTWHALKYDWDLIKFIKRILNFQLLLRYLTNLDAKKAINSGVDDCLDI